jgi:hypothetical protein
MELLVQFQEQDIFQVVVVVEQIVPLLILIQEE